MVLKAGASADGLADELVAAVRDEIGAVACFRLVDVVPALPKTRSGKILRKTMRGIAHGKDEPPPSTIEDPAVLDSLRPILRELVGYAGCRPGERRGGFPQPPVIHGHRSAGRSCGQVDISSNMGSINASTASTPRSRRWPPSTRMSPTRYAATGCSSGWKPRNGAS